MSGGTGHLWPWYRISRWNQRDLHHPLPSPFLAMRWVMPVLHSTISHLSLSLSLHDCEIFMKVSRHQINRRDDKGWGESQYCASPSLRTYHPGNGHMVWGWQPARPSSLLKKARRLYPEILRANSRFGFQHWTSVCLRLHRMLRSSQYQGMQQT